MEAQTRGFTKADFGLPEQIQQERGILFDQPLMSRFYWHTPE